MFKKTSLSHTYWIAFTILAMWAAFAYYTMHSLIASQQTYGKLINLSGMQRMLSQKTALYGHLLLHHALPPEQLATPVQTMKTNHRFITEHLTSEDLRRRYFGDGGLDGKVRRYFALLDTFMAHPTPPQGEAITRYAMTLLPHLDEAVSVFEQENEAVVQALKRRELYIFFGTLLTLVLEALLIVAPMIRAHRRYLETLEAEVKRRTQQIAIYARIFENSREGMVITDARETILNVNAAFSQITGYPRSEALGQTPRLLHSGRQSPGFYEKMWELLLRNGLWQGEIINKRKDGTEIHEHLTIMRLVDGETVNYVSVFSDISERIRNEAKLQYLAGHDSLTGLFNRMEILRRMDHAVALAERSGHRMAILFIDLDNFKVINDSMGHAVGDRLLIAVSHHLAASIRKSDTLGRLGGDEFVIVLEYLNHPGDELPVIETLLQRFSEPVMIDDKELFTAASIGVVFYPDTHTRDECSAQSLLRKADLAMYRAKEEGKNRVAYYSDDLEQRIQSQLIVANLLRDAITGDELTLHLQPKVDLRTGRITGAEALIRWYREGQLISPQQFIPIAEESHLIKQIDLWVVTETLRLLETIHVAGFTDFSIALNLSGRTFSDFHAMETILQTITQSGKAHTLEIEITEGVLVENLLFASARIEKLKALGIGIALDDFGTGYSSFSYLSKMPIDTIKIDHAFIGNLQDQRHEILIEAIISFSKKLAIGIVAEGIETPAQLSWLQAQGCDYGQGHHFSRPIPVDALIALLQTDAPL